MTDKLTRINVKCFLMTVGGGGSITIPLLPLLSVCSRPLTTDCAALKTRNTVSFFNDKKFAKSAESILSSEIAN